MFKNMERYTYQSLVTYERDYSLTGLNGVVKMCMDENGDISVNRNDVLRNRNLVIGIGVGRKDKIVIAYPKGNAFARGYHDEPEGFIFGIPGGKVEATIHGNVTPADETRGDSPLVVTVYKAHPNDLKTDEAMDPIEGTLRERKSWELGRLYPEWYIGKGEAQRIMFSLGANRFRIVYDKPSSEAWDIVLVNRYPVPLMHVPADKYLSHNGD